MSPATAFTRDLPKIDDTARDGRFHLVSDGTLCAVCRWNGTAWVFQGGHPLDFTPDRYKP